MIEISLLLATLGFLWNNEVKSISELAYKIPTWIYSLWILVLGLLLFPYIENVYLALALEIGVAGVSATALYKTNKWHYVFGIICEIVSLIIIITIDWRWLLITLLLIPMIYYSRKRWVFWVEIVTYYTLISVLR